MNSTKNKKTEIREIVYCQDDEKSFGDVFVYEPENIDEQRLGNLFIVGELQNLPRNCSYIINLLASKIKKEFYSNTKRTQEESLEAGLMAANGVLSEIARQGNGEYIGKLNMVCGTYKNKKFYISQIGKFKSLLIRGKKISEIVKEEDMQPFSPERVFNNIAGGELMENDMIIFTTHGLLNIFSQDKIRKLAGSNIDDFAGKLQDKIEEEGEELVSALIIKIEGNEVNGENGTIEEEVIPEESIKPEVAKEESAEKTPDTDIIKTTEEKGTEIIAQEQKPQVDTEIPQEIKEPITPKPEKEAIKNSKPQLKKEEIKKVSLSDIIKEYEKMEGQKTAENIGDKGLENIINKKEETNFGDLDDRNDGIVDRIKTFIGKIKGETKLPEIAQNSKKDLLEKKRISLIPNKKILIGLSLLVVVGGGFYYSSVKKQEADAAKLKNYQSILSDSKAKMDEAELEIISDSDKNAGKLFMEAKTLAQKVKDEYDGLDQQADEIISKAQQEIDRIDLVQKIENPSLIATISTNSSQKIAEVSGNVYIIDATTKTISKVDKEKQQLQKIADFDSSLGEIKNVTVFQNQEILVSDGSKIASFNPKNSQSYLLEESTELENFGSITAYSKYVYFLSPSQNQIYKTQKNGQKLDGKTDWMKSGNIQDAISITIDQFVYTLSSTGEVRKYFIGSEFVDNNNKKFALGQPSDPITSPDKIMTIPEKKYLFILESKKNRVLVFNKTDGSLIKQLTGTDFNGIYDFSVDLEEKNITIITNSKVFYVPIN